MGTKADRGRRGILDAAIWVIQDEPEDDRADILKTGVRNDDYGNK